MEAMHMKSRESEARRQTAMPIQGSFLGVVFALLLVISTSAQSKAAELKEATEVAWDRYVHSLCLRTEVQPKAASFLQIDDMPEILHRVQSGDVPVWRDVRADSPHVAHALIHQWAGAVFIPGATIADVLAVTRDYARYPEIYKPAVLAAGRLASGGDDDRFSMLLVQKVLFVTAALKGEYQTRYVRVNAKQWYSISQSTRLQAIEKFGQPDMRTLPPDQGPGYIWRLYTITKFEESDGGVYIELEALGLSRDVPVMFRWLVDPIVEHLPKNAVRATLEETRNAVLARINGED
jgi:hypothetical protein